jgi:3-isopropylmalate/(R)-2-methylmalate dehydratase small subunit
MKELIRGRVIKMPFNDVSTDVIAPNRYRATSGEDREMKALRPWIMGALRPGLDDLVKPGDVFVVGRNFGLGSHRETAVRIFQIWGVQAIVAESAARLWFRNAIAAGLPVFQLKGVMQLVEEGEPIEIDLKNWCIRTAKNAAHAHRINPYPPTVMRILEEGGIMKFLKKRADTELGQASAA